MKEESLLGPQASTKSSKEWVTFWETLSLENKLKSLILLHCETIFGAKKQIILFGDFQINDRILFNFISNQRKTEPFLLCFILWSVQNGKKQKPNANFTAVVPNSSISFCVLFFFSLSKTHHVSSFPLLPWVQRFQVQNNWPSSLFCSTKKSFFMSILDGCVKRERKALLRV